MNYDKFFDFFPTKYQSQDERVESTSRFIIYTGILISIYRKNVIPIMFSIAILIFFYIMMKMNRKVTNSKLKRHYNPSGCDKVEENCQQPSVTNPFANVLIGDEPNRNHACPIDDVEKDVTNKFNSTVIKSEFDIYDNQNSQRQFYSNPNTSIPNDQTGFANWLYGQDEVCKSHPTSCTGFEGANGAGGSRAN